MVRKLRKWIILLCLVLLPLMAVVLQFRRSDREKTMEYRNICRSIYILIKQEDDMQVVHPWRDETGVYYLVLPTYAGDAELSFGQTNQYERFILLDGSPVDTIVVNKESKQEYQMTITSLKGRVLEESRLQVLFSDKLPAVYVTTKTGNMDTIHASKENKEKGTVAVYTENGNIDYEGQLNFIKGRGNVTWQEKKKPYNLSLEQDTALLSMDASTEWVLLAGAKDPTYIRNKLAFTCARQIGLKDTSDSAFVDLYLNGEYAGLYLLTEKVGDEDPESFGENSSSKEYLLEMEMQDRLETEENAFQTEAGQGIVIKSKASEQEQQALADWIQRFENAVYQNDWKRIGELADLDSFVKIYLVEEILQNHDAYISSQYLRLFESDGTYSPIYSGPVWDFDSCLTPKDGMFVKTLTAAQSRADYPKYWMPYFTDNEVFQEMVREEYSKVRKQYLEEQVWSDIESTRELLDVGVELDSLRWHYHSKEDWLNELESLKAYLKTRLAFLDELWIEGEQFLTVHVEVNSDTFTNMDYMVKPGEVCREFPAYFTKQGFQFAGWFVMNTDTRFDMEQPIYESVSIEAKWQEEHPTSAVEVLRRMGILQARYLLFVFLLVAVTAIFIWDWRRNRR